MSDIDRENQELGRKLLAKLLKNYDAILDDGTITAADRAALAKLLMANGYEFDARKVPKNVSSFLDKVDPRDITDEDEPAIVGRIATG